MEASPTLLVCPHEVGANAFLSMVGAMLDRLGEGPGVRGSAALHFHRNGYVDLTPLDNSGDIANALFEMVRDFADDHPALRRLMTLRVQAH